LAKWHWVWTSRGPGEEHCYVCPAGGAVLKEAEDDTD